VTPRRLAYRLLACLRWRCLDADLESEILAHLELAERDGVARGLSPEEARRRALLEFGGVEQIKEDHRAGRGVMWLEHALRDFRNGLSGLGRHPGFATAAVGILAIGIGATTAVFSVVDAVLLKPLPFAQPDRMVTVIEADRGRFWGVSALNFVDWHRIASSFEALSAESQVTASVMVGREPERWTGYLATADYFKVYGVAAARGRTFGPGEDRPDAPRVIVVSHAAWQDRFGGVPDILDRELIVDGEAHRIVGVLPPGSFDREQALFWKPLVFTPERLTRESMGLRAVGRLRPGVSLERARAEMMQVSANLERVNPPWKKGWRAAVRPFGQDVVSQRLRQSIYVAFGAVVMVLLIASANIGTLLLVRGSTRRKEMAVRAALGASRSRLVGQLLSESLALCAVGGAAGVGLAFLLVQAARPLLSRMLPPTADVSLDPRVLVFAACLVLSVSLLVGLLPALRTSAGFLADHLNDAARGSSPSRSFLRRAMVVSEVAVSLVLVCGAMLMLRSLLNLQSANPGFRVDNVITTSLQLPAPAYPRADSVTAFFRTLVERLRTVPGIESASVASDLPLEGLGSGSVVVAPGLVEGRVVVGLKWVDPRYFWTLDIGVVSGRGVTDRDVAGAPRVVVVNQELAARLGTPDPVGRVVSIALSEYGSTRADLVDLRIVGVIRSECTGQLHEPASPVAYLPEAQWAVPDMRLVVRTSGDATAVTPAMRKIIRKLDPGLPLGEVSTMRQVKERSFTDTTESTWAVGLFALVAALLAASGLYGVLTQAVAQQRQEIGIRMALGAAPRAMVSRILRGAMAMVGGGLAAGLLAAMVLTGVMKGLLFQVSALDPLAFVLACATMALVGVVAVLVPASRAARVDPVLTLREEG
jgi:predicted permease